MKKILFILLVSLSFSTSYASKLSKYIKKSEARNHAQQQREWQQDMNFADLDFRFDRRYIDENKQSCREYVFRARSNPYRSGRYTVCENDRIRSY